MYNFGHVITRYRALSILLRVAESCGLNLRMFLYKAVIALVILEYFTGKSCEIPLVALFVLRKRFSAPLKKGLAKTGVKLN